MSVVFVALIALHWLSFMVALDERDLRIQHAASRAGSGLMAMLIAKTLSENVHIVVRYRREHA